MFLPGGCGPAINRGPTNVVILTQRGQAGEARLLYIVYTGYQMGGEELDRLRAACAGQGNGAAAQHVGEQVGQRTVGAHRHALAIDVVVRGRGRPA